MAIINMKQTCEKNGITSFSRTRGGWMKMVEGIDKTKKGGYSFIGDNFYKVGNFETNIPNGLYLDQSTAVTNDEKNLTMNLFKINDGTVTLIKSIPKTSGWATKLWDDVDKYFHETTPVTAQDIINTIKEMTTDENIIEDVISRLYAEKSDERCYEFKNWYEVKSILCDIGCYLLPIKTVEEIGKSDLHKDEYVFKYDAKPNKYAYNKWMTTAINLHHKIVIDENTHVDYRSITPTTFRTKQFQKEIKTKDFVNYIVRTAPNNTGYHNRVVVTLFYYEKNTVCIREFEYFIDRYKFAQVDDEFLDDY